MSYVYNAADLGIQSKAGGSQGGVTGDMQSHHQVVLCATQ